MTAHDVLLAFSEWLDGEGIAIVPPDDERTHDDLAGLFAAANHGTPIGEWIDTQGGAG